MWYLLEQNWASATAALVSVIVLLTSYIIWTTHNKYQYFVKNGLKGPKPIFPLGNLRDLFDAKNSIRNVQLQWLKEYGKLYGIFFVTKPAVFVADAELIQKICIKDFDVFPNHTVHNLMVDYQRKWLIFLQDDEWRRVRALMSPTFTSGKIKRMFAIFDNCSDDLIASLEEQLSMNPENGQYSAKINVKQAYCMYTLNTITTCCFGLQLKRATGVKSLEDAASRDEVAKVFLRFFTQHKSRFILGHLLPKRFLAWFGFTTTPYKQYSDVADIAKKVIDARRQLKDDKKFDDYLQLLIDARLQDELNLDSMDQSENHHTGLSQDSLKEDQRKMVDQIRKQTNNSKVTLTDFELLSESMLLLLVGMETTANLLTNCAYALSYHPEVQEKLYGIVKPLAKYDKDNSPTFDYDDITTCKYLDSVLSETLRRLPIITMIDRVASQDYHIEKYNFTIQKGMQAFLCYYSLMNDPDYWHEPEAFNPERFMPENRDKIVPGSYVPFGTGPRHCIGMRFSLTEAKLALAKLVMKFKFMPAEGSKFPPEMTSTIGISSIEKPEVIVKPRN